MQMYCRQAATEAERERALVSEHEETGLGGPGWGWGVGLKAQIRRFERGMFWRCCKTLHTTPTSFSPKPPPPRAPFSSPPISHLMCGGCWEPHAKMNNNRLLVTIAHEHTPPLSLSLFHSLSLCHLLSHLLSRSPWDAQTAFSLWFTNTLRFRFTSLSLSLSAHHSATLTFGLKVTLHIPVFHTALTTRYQRGWWYWLGDNMCVCVRACLCTRELRPQRIFCVCGSISALARICRYSQCLQIEINLWRTLLIVVFIEMQPRRFVVQI